MLKVCMNMVTLTLAISFYFLYSIYHGTGVFQFKDCKQSFRLQESQVTYSIKCYITIYKHKLPNDILLIMLQHRQQLLMHLQNCVSEVHHSHIPCAREPIGYLECPLQHDGNCHPHIRLDQLNTSEDIVCPKSNHQIVPFETYALLFTTSLGNGTYVSIHNYCIPYTYVHPLQIPMCQPLENYTVMSDQKLLHVGMTLELNY